MFSVCRSCIPQSSDCHRVDRIALWAGVGESAVLKRNRTKLFVFLTSAAFGVLMYFGYSGPRSDRSFVLGCLLVFGLATLFTNDEGEVSTPVIRGNVVTSTLTTARPTATPPSTYTATTQSTGTQVPPTSTPEPTQSVSDQAKLPYHRHQKRRQPLSRRPAVRT